MDDDAFLRAILTAPNDHAARLVYADWLEERGDDRAEYLRLEAESMRIQARLEVLRQQLDAGWLNVVSPDYLRYEIAYHMHCQLPLRSGRTITLDVLEQSRTYAGQLAGTPSRWSNDRHIEYVLQAAERYCVEGAQPHLIQPPRRDYLREPGDMQRIAARSPHHVPEWLPMVRCIGSFKDVVKARDPGKDLSVLTVVWFQDEFAMPIREPALSQLLELNWESLAVDIDI